MEDSIMATSIIRFSNIALATLFAGGASGATPAVTMSGPHANEEFCKTMIRQVELSGEYMKNQPLVPDTARLALPPPSPHPNPPTAATHDNERSGPGPGPGEKAAGRGGLPGPPPPPPPNARPPTTQILITPPE